MASKKNWDGCTQAITAFAESHCLSLILNALKIRAGLICQYFKLVANIFCEYTNKKWFKKINGYWQAALLQASFL
jgi:hypothetical protein